jgi:dipeptidyl aminopeptidase/acylaminoacyl peptidase
MADEPRTLRRQAEQQSSGPKENAATPQPQGGGRRSIPHALFKEPAQLYTLSVSLSTRTDGQKTILGGIADPKRVGIFGASYGGYAALAGATLTPEMYACVISFEGISNLPDMMGYERREFRINFTNGSYTATRIGDIFTDSAQLDATSPALHADRVTAPVLLLHSELDVTVPITQSETMEAALRKARKKVQFVRIPGDDHYMSLEATRSRVLDEVATFLAASIGT